ncbi:amino acid permease [Legionella sp. W05-934-2]|uniref:amino acid permease n=1 Tax=Legionella sp. W05-934-2 TaxID=1198649 RepID=UPI0034638306
MNSKLIGGILLIIGTSIGGGMLALPVVTAEVGFFNSLIFLVLTWLVMTAGALLVLEVNLRLPEGSNMVSMARHTLGMPGQIVAWIAYLFLLYTLLAGYISGGSDVLGSVLTNIGLPLSEPMAALAFTGLFGLIVYAGIQAVDYVNRGLMFGKLGIYILLILIISPHINVSLLSGGRVQAAVGSLMVLVTSFGFASIVPSLRDYFDSDVNQLRKVVLWGSLIPLTCYILWDAVIMGVIQRDGEFGLLQLMQSSHATSGLTNALSLSVSSQLISGFFAFFTSICMLTAFLGVSIGLFDFLADGLKWQKGGLQGKGTFLLTFLPPLLIVLVKPGIYLSAMRYAGICCVVLLLLLPVAMAWQGRKNNNQSLMLVPGGKSVLVMVGVVAIYLLSIAI